jgi:hypothetical protein
MGWFIDIRSCTERQAKPTGITDFDAERRDFRNRAQKTVSLTQTTKNTISDRSSLLDGYNLS